VGGRKGIISLHRVGGINLLVHPIDGGSPSGTYQVFEPGEKAAAQSAKGCLDKEVGQRHWEKELSPAVRGNGALDLLNNLERVATRLTRKVRHEWSRVADRKKLRWGINGAKRKKVS